jgi:hypothetical protein
MSRGAYLVGCAELLALAAAIGLTAFRVRAWLLPSWSGSTARLAELILGITLLIWIVEVLGTLSLFGGPQLVLTAVLLGLGAWRSARRPSLGLAAHSERVARWPPLSPVALAIAGAISLVVLTKWLLIAKPFIEGTRLNLDSMAYHQPLAAGFAQTGSVTQLNPFEPIYLSWFSPANSELFHAIGMATLNRDVVTPLINFGWLGLALLAAWCVGRPYGVAPASLTAVAVLLVSPVLNLSPGTAMTDVMGIALLLASTAILISAVREQPADEPKGRKPLSTGPLIVAGLAAGLAAGTRLNLIAPVAALTAGVIALAGRGSRGTVGAIWIVSALGAGGFWYLRNLLSAGNPLPWIEVDLGLFSLPTPEHLEEPLSAFSVAHYLTDSRVWSDYFLPGVKSGFGDLWFLVLALAFAGILGSLLSRNTAIRRAIGAAALIGVAAYLLTPRSATGLEGHPVRFGVNLRFLAPPLAIGLALAPTIVPSRHRELRWLLTTVLGVLLLVTLEPGATLNDASADQAILIATAVGLVVFSVRTWVKRGLSPASLVFCLAAIAILATAAYWRTADNYLDKRYARSFPAHLNSSFRWARDESGARIALAGTAGTFYQYGYYGDDISNRVIYIGRRGAHSGIVPFEVCADWRTAINDGGFDYVMTTPSWNFQDPNAPEFSPERSWADPDPALHEVFRAGQLSVYRVDGLLDPAGCGRINGLFSGLPPPLKHAE